jgi:hypothetical protein
MTIDCNLIMGVMVGFEFVEQDEDKFLVIDLFIIRLLFLF